MGIKFCSDENSGKCSGLAWAWHKHSHYHIIFVISSCTRSVVSEASGVARQCGAHYAEVIKDGKTERCPLAYNQIITELITELAQFQVKSAPQKITFEFDSKVWNFILEYLVEFETFLTYITSPGLLHKIVEVMPNSEALFIYVQ